MSDEKKPTMIDCKLCRKPKRFESEFTPQRNEISAWSKICKSCEELWELGKKAQKAAKADGKVGRARVKLEINLSGRFGDETASSVIKSSDIITAMGAVKMRGIELGSHFRGGQEDISIGDVNGDYRGSEPVTVSAERAKAMERIIKACYAAAAKARIEGFNEGRNLLAGLARGSLKLADFDERADNSRAGRKPVKRWDD